MHHTKASICEFERYECSMRLTYSAHMLDVSLICSPMIAEDVGLDLKARGATRRL